MSEVLAIMFKPEGRPTAYLMARWRAKGALKPLQPAAIYVGGGYAKPVFRALWKQAFPTRDPLPTDAIATRDGRFTPEMLGIWLD